MAHTESADQPALGSDGQLLDASKIAWYNDPDDPHPIQPTSTSSRVQEGEVLNFITILRRLIYSSGQVGQRSRPIRATVGARLAEAIATEKLNEYGSLCRRFILPRDAKVSAKRKQPTTDESHGIGDVTPLILSRLHALRLCFLLTLFVQSDRLYRLPDSLRTLPLSRYLAALVSTRLTMLTFLFRICFSRSRCLCLLTLLS
jgi:hypothetical protein